MESKKKVERTEKLKKAGSSLSKIFTNTQNTKDNISDENWTESINALKEKQFYKLSDAIDAVVNEVILRMKMKGSSEFKVFLHDLCTDSPKIMECIEKELM